MTPGIAEKTALLAKNFQSFKTEVTSNIADKMDSTEKAMLRVQNAQEIKLTGSFEESKAELVKELKALSSALSRHIERENSFNTILQKLSQDTYEKTARYENLLGNMQNDQKEEHKKLTGKIESLKSDLNELKKRKTYSGIMISTFVFSLISMILSILGFVIK